ncbi:MAG: CRISPR-associated endonuclease Cas2 [Desulfobacca sp. 4484_104]|nr:MAG: CRISPR-associated endonuclease Cas2 [Desulfobacca sp. 4484_104]RLA87625.1 MAG: CRISPR-associated endonuclease Cas2 [Deltaproteobacteria bacterium]
MGEEKHWHLICYDIRDPKRWAKAYKILKGCGDHLQLSIFRAHLSKTRLASLRHKLSKILEGEDSLLIVRLCPSCAQRIIDSTGTEKWVGPDVKYEIY